MNRATGAGEVTEDFISNLSRISQLTGFSDPIYAEAYVKVHGFDISLGKLLRSSLRDAADIMHYSRCLACQPDF